VADQIFVLNTITDSHNSNLLIRVTQSDATG